MGRAGLPAPSSDKFRPSPDRASRAVSSPRSALPILFAFLVPISSCRAPARESDAGRVPVSAAESLPRVPLAADWPYGKAAYEGVLVKTLFERFAPADADILIFRCADGFACFFPRSLAERCPAGLVTRVGGKTPDAWPLHKGKPMGYYVGLPTRDFPAFNAPAYNNDWPWQVESMEPARSAELRARMRAGRFAPLAAAASRGEDVFLAQCIHCHRVGGVGGRVGPPMEAAARGQTLEAFARWVKSPRAVNSAARMPSFSEVLSEDEIGDLYRYVRGTTGG